MTAVWSAPVRYAECDQQGIVFNGHYLTWADEAATAWLAQVGLPYATLLDRGLDMRVVASSLSWASPARWGETVEVHAFPGDLGRSSFGVRLEVKVGERLCCTVVTTYVMTDHQGTPLRVPDDLRAHYPG